jgi:hypothetical protein
MKTRAVFSFGGLKSRDRALFYFGSCYPDTGVFPFQYRYEVIPYLIDTWPEYWSRLFRFMERNQTRLIFFSQGQMCREVGVRFPGIRAFHISEGVDLEAYDRGPPLAGRCIDLLELGRRHEPTHGRIVRAAIKGMLVHRFEDTTKAGFGRLVFPDQASLVRGLADTKIAICWPQSFTHPAKAGGIQTLTLRYWELMLSRVVMMGRAPKELVDLIGYNPVVDLEPEHVPEQIEEVLAKLGTYQSAVDANYQAALKYGSWDSRVRQIREIMEATGYAM